MYEKLSEICKKHDISLLYLFGSQKDSALQILHGLLVSISDPLTDIDVGVVFCQPRRLKVFVLMPKTRLKKSVMRRTYSEELATLHLILGCTTMKYWRIIE